MSSINRRRFCATCMAAATFPIKTNAQEYIEANTSMFCAGSEMVYQPGLWTFESSQEARDIVQKICDAVQLPQNFDIRAAAVGENIGNAAAFVVGGGTSNARRMIVYNERWVQTYLRESGEAYWSGVALMAHECGHHLSGHTLDNTGSQPARELEADRFAGSIVGRLGGSLSEAEALFKSMSTEASRTHPARMDRLQAVAVGWTQATANIRTDPPPPPDQKPVGTDELCEFNPFYEEEVGARWLEGSGSSQNEIRRIRKCDEMGRLYEGLEARYTNPRSDWLLLFDTVRPVD